MSTNIDEIAEEIAHDIDQALADEFQKVKGIELPSEGQEDRRMLFIAIAKGIVSYFSRNENIKPNTK